MPRNDGNGRNLKAVLTYILNRAVTDNEISTAIGISKSYYLSRRREADDYPNAEECRVVAEHFGLNPVELLVLFGLIDSGAVHRYAERYLAGKTADRFGRPMAVPPTVVEIASDNTPHYDGQVKIFSDGDGQGSKVPKP